MTGQTFTLTGEIPFGRTGRRRSVLIRVETRQALVGWWVFEQYGPVSRRRWYLRHADAVRTFDRADDYVKMWADDDRGEAAA